MSNKLAITALLGGAALAAGVWAQDKPSPFSDNSSAATDVTTVVTNNNALVPVPALKSNSFPVSGAATTNPDAQRADLRPTPPPVLYNSANNNPRAASSSRDPFPEDVSIINQADLVWRAAQNRLEELGSGCISDGTQIIDQARDSKLKSVASYAKYYQDTITYWTKSRDSSGEAELSSRTDSAELQAHVNQLQLELQSVNRRKADLDRTFGENHIDNNDERAALQDLTRIQTNKQEQVEKARAAVDQNKAGHDWVMKRREYARVRLSETNDLLQSTRTELYLYQQLYNAILYRHSLSCDREVSRPIETLSDWRQDLKKLSPPAE